MSDRFDKAKDINILIVGETGIGKSTWINAIATYLKYDNFKKASKSPLINLIPTDFTHQPSSPSKKEDDEAEIEPQFIKIGGDGNEHTGAGTSRTRKPKIHLLEHNSRVIRLVDTPGINDTNGILQDQKNMQEVVDCVSKLSHLNLIVFLMAHDQSRLTPAFEFCFKELITQFHRDAAENIVFAFTKSPKFKVGETITSLKLLLKDIKDQQGIDLPLNKKTTYAFDNESYRFLCILSLKVKNGESLLSKKDIKSAQESFKVSRDEFLKLLKHAHRVNPHDPQSTAALNYTRNIINRIVGPMTMISVSVQQTLEKIRERQALLAQFRGNESELEKILWHPIIIVRYRMERKDTVFCKNCATIRFYYGDERLPYIEADPEMADKDPLEMWVTDGCPQKDDGEWYCPECGDDFIKSVSHKRFSHFHDTQLEKNVTVESRLENVHKSQQSIAEKISEDHKFRDEIIQEREFIIKACAKFAAYLKASSILPYNDDTARYLDTLMSVELKKKNGFETKYYESLCIMKKEYLEEKAIFNQDLKKVKTKGEITPAEINALVQELVGLKHYGKDIADAFNFVKVDEDRGDGGIEERGNPSPASPLDEPHKIKTWWQTFTSWLKL